jgi:hypothetical protein
VVPHPSTRQAQARLTSEFWWFRVHSYWYGRMLYVKCQYETDICIYTMIDEDENNTWHCTLTRTPDTQHVLILHIYVHSCCTVHTRDVTPILVRVLVLTLYVAASIHCYSSPRSLQENIQRKWQSKSVLIMTIFKTNKQQH